MQKGGRGRSGDAYKAQDSGADERHNLAKEQVVSRSTERYALQCIKKSDIVINLARG